nr:hypothetical protein [Amycolatopsis aidingensis]
MGPPNWRSISVLNRWPPASAEAVPCWSRPQSVSPLPYRVVRLTTATPALLRGCSSASHRAIGPDRTDCPPTTMSTLPSEPSASAVHSESCSWACAGTASPPPSSPPLSAAASIARLILDITRSIPRAVLTRCRHRRRAGRA